MAVNKILSSRLDAQLPTSTSTTTSTPAPVASATTRPLQSHGDMAPVRRGKNLVCFYCNKKSSIKYDGLTRWDCAQCESTNFLDENGEITDPPVATEDAAPGDLKYTIPLSGSQSSGAFEPNPFCATCIKNQHLFTSSLAQYHIEIDKRHPQEFGPEYFAFRKNLERLYPQTCAECQPKTRERMREADRKAMADHVRRSNERTRARKLNTSTEFSFSKYLDNLGRGLWYIGLSGQLLWNFMALIVISQNSAISFPKLPWVTIAIRSITPMISTSNSEARGRSSLTLSILAIWWNPMFKQMNSGFMNHIKGFRDWYKLQLLIIVTRSLFYYYMGTGIFADALSPATTGAHIFMAVVVTLLSLKARHALRVDNSRLWGTTPEEALNVESKPSNLTTGMASMVDVLDQIVATPARVSRQPLQQSPPVYNRFGRNDTIPILPVNTTNVLTRGNTGPFLQAMTESESVHYMATGELPARLQNLSDDNDAEKMEWTPSQTPRSQHCAFNTPRILQQKPQLFGETPTGDQPSPFWFKVPPAPVTPAQRLRNPPNQPKLRVSSPETNENFFNNVTRRNLGTGQISDQQTTGAEQNKHSINFSQQKFFPHNLPTEAGNNLADLLTSFSIANADRDAPKVTEAGSPGIRHIFQGLGLVLGLIFWIYSHHNPSEHNKAVWLTVLFGCLSIAARTIFDGTIHTEGTKQGLWLRLMTFLGWFGFVVSGYGILEILAGRGGCEMCALSGTVLISGMLILEIALLVDAYIAHQ